VNYSRSGLKLTESFEGCKLAAYQDSTGRWTIGYGHTGHDVYPGLEITQIQAEQFLLQDVQWASECINRLVMIQLSQSEFDALVDFCFNVGCGNFAGSTLLKLLNAGNISAAAQEFDKWDHAGGKVVAGLLRRRQAETAEFTGA